MKNWYVGQKVVCIDSYSHEINTGLKKGEIYTIKKIFECKVTNPYPHRINDLTFHLQELDPPRTSTYHMIGFNSERFRPLIEKKTDISVFKAMLNRTPLQNELNLKVLEEVKDNA